MSVLAAAPAATAAARHPGHAAQCASTSSTGMKPSKYNTIPSGVSTWTVPLDPCNTEGGGDYYTNCAYWAAEKRPDVWVNAVWKYGYPGNLGGWDVELDAKRAHYVVNHRPKVGDIAAWPPSATMGHERGGVIDYASSGGHVAYVQKVNGHKITISEMGVANHHGRTAVLTFNKHKTFFIHKKH